MFKKMIAVVAVCVGFAMADAGQANAGNGSSSWRWSKPLNQRQGLLYTTNKARKTTNTRTTRKRCYSSGNTTRWFTPSSPSPSSSSSDTFFRPGRSGIIPFDGVGRSYPFYW